MKSTIRICAVVLIALLPMVAFSGDGKLPEGNVPDAVELAVLEDIYTTMGGSSWTNDTNWPTSWPATATNTDYATWHGITVTGGDITAIVLNSNGLTSAIPASIGDLAELTYLDLSINAITGDIPATIGDLSKLFYLSLAHNQLESIPDEIGQASALRQVYLHSNQITGALPSSITSLVNLKELFLYVNDVTGTLPTDIGNMTALEILWLDGNNMSGSIPASIGDLPVLRYLNLSSNAFSGAIPSSIGNLNALQYLFLGGNQLSGSIPQQLGSLTNLVELSLLVNQLSGSIPVQLGGLSNLRVLDFSGNQLTGAIPSTFENLTQLTQIQIRNNDLSGSLPDLSNLDDLVALYLENNALTGSIPSSLGQLEALAYLSLGGNQLTGNIPSSLGSLSHLVELGLNSNKLSGPIPTTLASINTLTGIYVGGNKFTFSDILPLHTLKPISDYSGQDKVDVEKTVNLQIGSTLHLSALIDRATTPASSYRWYKKIGEVLTELNEMSTTGHSIAVTGLTASDDGLQFLYVITNSAAPSTQHTSNLWTLNMVTCNSPAVDFETAVDSYTYIFTPSVTDAESCTVTYLWDFGDGQTSPDPTSSHVYNTTGTYVVSLTLSYQCGECDSTAVVVEDTVDVTNTSICTAIYCDGVGGVGIGTMHTQGFRLSVDGKIRASDIIKVYPQGQWSDFVFEEDYRLKPLSEVEKFIKTNGHLPDIPSAKEVEENGVELGSMDAKLLQKIEELTLYMIESKKRGDELEGKMKLIEKENKLLKEKLSKIEVKK